LVFYGERSASVGLYLDGLPPDLAARVAVLPPRRLDDDLRLVSGAGMLIFVRGFERAWRSGFMAALDRIGVPCAWFTDDDLTALKDEQPGFGFYSAARVQAFARRMCCLIGTTAPLCDRLRAFHPKVLHWPCVADPGAIAPARGSGQVLRVGIIGGAFRDAGLRDLVRPALDTLPGVEVVVTQALAPAVPQARTVPFELDFKRFLGVWRKAGPDLLLHPPGRTANLTMKGPGTLLCALYLGAVPVVGDEPAYRGLGPAEGVTCVGPTVTAWRQALLRLSDPESRREQLAHLRRHALRAWSPERARATVETLLEMAAPGGAAARARRAAAAALGWHPPFMRTMAARLRRAGRQFARPRR
jgi:hypothetical protein